MVLPKSFCNEQYLSKGYFQAFYTGSILKGSFQSLLLSFIWLIGVSCCFLFSSVQPAFAISLDQFQGNPDGNQTLIASGVGGIDSDVVNDVTAIGGTRSVQLLSTSNGILNFFAGVVTNTPPTYLMSHSQSSSATGDSFIVYDGDSTPGLTNTAGLGGLNLMEDNGTALLLNVVEYDFPFSNPLDITVTVYDAGDPLGQTFSVGTVTLNTAMSNVVIPLDFASLNGFQSSGPGGHADFSNVGAITVYIDGNTPAHDLELRLFGTDGECDHVPVDGLVLDECGVCNGPSTDSDSDGTPDCNDECPNDPNKIERGTCGCGVADTDSDGDGTPNCNDNCPTDADKIEPGLCGCGTTDLDSDGDGSPDCNDQCDTDPNKTQPGVCGCGVIDTDTDSDGTFDCNETCDSDPNKTEPGVCGCGVADSDTDGDGTLDCNEVCDNDPNKTDPGACGCGQADTDTDGDGNADCTDQCPSDPDKESPGICGCGISDVDTDSDGTADCEDQCDDDPLKVTPGTCGCGTSDVDNDLDGVPDCNDNCDSDPNKTEPGSCGCGVPDTDSDSDGVADCVDQCDQDPNKSAPGVCGCGNVDTDSDGDGTADCNDSCVDDPGKVEPGQCGCGVVDADSDNDGIANCEEECDNDPLKTTPGICGCGVSDIDTDGDLISDCQDECSEDPAKTSAGVCGCGVLDLDDDGDGALNCNDECPDLPTLTVAGECGCDLSIVPDRCGVCGGDGMSCLDCQQFDISDTQALLDNGGIAQEQLIRRNVRNIRRISTRRGARLRTFLRESLALANDLQLENWGAIYSIEADRLVCSNSFCVQSTTAESVLAGFRERSDQLRQLGIEVVTRLRRTMRREGKSRRRRITREMASVDTLHAENLRLADTIPAVNSDCG